MSRKDINRTAIAVAFVVTVACLVFGGAPQNDLREGQVQNFLRLEGYTEYEIDYFLSLGRVVVIDWDTGDIVADTAFLKVPEDMMVAYFMEQKKDNTIVPIKLYDFRGKMRKG